MRGISYSGEIYFEDVSGCEPFQDIGCTQFLKLQCLDITKTDFYLLIFSLPCSNYPIAKCDQSYQMKGVRNELKIQHGTKNLFSRLKNCTVETILKTLDNIKMNFNVWDGTALTDACKQGNKIWSFVKCREITDQLSGLSCQILPSIELKQNNMSTHLLSENKCSKIAGSKPLRRE